MTGVLRAKVAGNWVDVQMPAPATDEVWVGPDDPGVNSQYEIWYDTDDDGPQYGNYAMGITNLGAFNIANGTLMPTSGATLFATVSNFYYTSGRRYRLFCEMNAVTSAAYASGAILLYIDGVAQAGGPWLEVSGGTNHYVHWSYEWYLEKYGMSAGLHTLQLYWSPTVGQMTMHTDMATIEVRDMGPSNPMNPLTQTTPPPWIPMAFATGWQSYGSGYQPGGYRKLGDMVFLKGLVTQVAGAAATIHNLPAGYRPGGTVIAGALTSTGMARYDISTGGVMTTSGTISVGNWVCLDGISFSTTPGN